MHEDHPNPAGPTSRRAFLASLAACAGLGLLAPHSTPAAGEAPAPKRWWKGNLHTHSFWSDGDHYPEMVALWYREHGYHFLSLTDHNIVAEGEKWVDLTQRKGIAAKALQPCLDRFGADWLQRRKTAEGRDEVRLKTLAEIRPRLEESGKFILITGDEISYKAPSFGMHINAIGLEHHIPAQDALDLLRRKGNKPFFLQLNHPNFSAGVTSEQLLGVQEGVAVEVYNAHPLCRSAGDATRPPVERKWDEVNLRRIVELKLPPLYATATDDAHNYHEFNSGRANPGRGFVMVRAACLTTEAIMAALAAGDFYASTGVELDELRQDGQGLTLRIKAQPEASYTTTFLGARRGSSEPGVVLGEVSGLEPQYAFKGDELYVRARVVSSRRMANPSKTNPEFETAWTQPVVPVR